jgi:iron complex outermembrane receptor protein
MKKVLLAQIAVLGKANTNWQEQIYRNALSSDNNLSVSGSLKSVPFRVSVGYTNQDGILKTSNMGRTSASIGISPTLLNNHLKIDVNLKAQTSTILLLTQALLVRLLPLTQLNLFIQAITTMVAIGNG